MSSEQTTPALGEEQAREVVNRWSGAGFFRLRNMGDKIFVEQVAPGAAYAIRLQTHYERRNVRTAREPYHGGPVDEQGRPPGPWDVPVRRPPAFGERTEVVPVPHTERVQMCGHCAGKGRVSCPRCLGQGRMPCPWCGGTGVVQQQVMDTGRDAQGNAVPMPRTVRRPCSCAGGQVACSDCAGRGVLRCPDCAGSGRVKTFDQLVVRFQTATQGELLDVTPVPDGWLGKLSGEVLVDEKAPRIEACGPVPPEVAQKAKDLLDQSHAVDEDQARILLQLLHVERIPLYEVRYKYAGVERKLWICGREQGVYAPNAPWNRQRLSWLVAGVVAAVLAVVGLAYFFLFRA